LGEKWYWKKEELCTGRMARGDMRNQILKIKNQRYKVKIQNLDNVVIARASFWDNK
jgi:hypothetical protein